MVGKKSVLGKTAEGRMRLLDIYGGIGRVYGRSVRLYVEGDDRGLGLIARAFQRPDAERLSRVIRFHLNHFVADGRFGMLRRWRRSARSKPNQLVGGSDAVW